MLNIGVILVAAGFILAVLLVITVFVFAALMRSSQLTQAYELASGAYVEESSR